MTEPIDLLAGLTDSVGVWGEHATDLQLVRRPSDSRPQRPSPALARPSQGLFEDPRRAGVGLVAVLTQFPSGATDYAARLRR